jgi:hypothetical protein
MFTALAVVGLVPECTKGGSLQKQLIQLFSHSNIRTNRKIKKFGYNKKREL